MCTMFVNLMVVYLSIQIDFDVLRTASGDEQVCSSFSVSLSPCYRLDCHYSGPKSRGAKESKLKNPKILILEKNRLPAVGADSGPRAFSLADVEKSQFNDGIQFPETSKSWVFKSLMFSRREKDMSSIHLNIVFRKLVDWRSERCCATQKDKILSPHVIFFQLDFQTFSLARTKPILACLTENPNKASVASSHRSFNVLPPSKWT